MKNERTLIARESLCRIVIKIVLTWIENWKENLTTIFFANKQNQF